jgi:hypothetical protein
MNRPLAERPCIGGPLDGQKMEVIEGQRLFSLPGALLYAGAAGRQLSAGRSSRVAQVAFDAHRLLEPGDREGPCSWIISPIGQECLWGHSGCI